MRGLRPLAPYLGRACPLSPVYAFLLAHRILRARGVIALDAKSVGACRFVVRNVKIADTSAPRVTHNSARARSMGAARERERPRILSTRERDPRREGFSFYKYEKINAGNERGLYTVARDAPATSLSTREAGRRDRRSRQFLPSCGRAEAEESAPMTDGPTMNST